VLPFQVQIPHFVRMISLVMADQLRTVVLNSINAFSRLWDAFDLAADPHAASAGCPLMKQDGSVEVSVKKRKGKKRKGKDRKGKETRGKERKEKKRKEKKIEEEIMPLPCLMCSRVKKASG